VAKRHAIALRAKATEKSGPVRLEPREVKRLTEA